MWDSFESKSMAWDESLGFSLPISMLLFGRDPISIYSIFAVLTSWHFILMYGGFMHHTVFLYFTRHHGVKIELKSEKLKNIDFGIYQLASTFDRMDFNSRKLILLSDHTLHHFFPSLDHAILPYLHKVFYETCKDFESEIRELSFWDDSIEKTFNT